LAEEDANAGIYHGAKLNLTGGLSAWASMQAPIHRVAWDIASGTTSVDFGPTPDYSAADYLEYIRLLRRRPVRWISPAERTSAELGDAEGPSKANDTVGQFDTPETVTMGGAGTALELPFALSVMKDGSTWKWRVSSKGSTLIDGTNGAAVSLPTGETPVGMDFDHPITATKWIVLQAEVSAGLDCSSWAFAAVDSADADEVGMTTATPPTQNKLRLLIGKITFTGSPAVATAAQATYSAQRLTYGWLNGVPVRLLESAPIKL
jgi:hypothetical protein